VTDQGHGPTAAVVGMIGTLTPLEQFRDRTATGLWPHLQGAATERGLR
jgi:hypothetical protein